MEGGEYSLKSPILMDVSFVGRVGGNLDLTGLDLAYSLVLSIEFFAVHSYPSSVLFNVRL